MKKILTIELEEDVLLGLLPHIMALQADFRVRSPQPAEYTSATVAPALVVDKPRKLQRRSPDGRTSRQVVVDKIASFGTKRFHIREVDSVARFTGFAAITLRSNLQAMVKEGLVQKIDRQHYRGVAVVVPIEGEVA